MSKVFGGKVVEITGAFLPGTNNNTWCDSDWGDSDCNCIISHNNCNRLHDNGDPLKK